MHCNFYIGQRIVCVNADPNATPGPGDLTGLKEGQTYTVRAISTSAPGWDAEHPDCANQIWVYLKEIQRDMEHVEPHPPFEVGYMYWRFRPATDISSLEALLHTTKVPEPA